MANDHLRSESVESLIVIGYLASALPCRGVGATTLPAVVAGKLRFKGRTPCKLLFGTDNPPTWRYRECIRDFIFRAFVLNGLRQSAHLG